MPPEPVGTALLLALCGALLAISVVFSHASQRIGLPIALLFLVIGMLAGSDGIGGIAFSDYPLAFRLGSTALALILFDGGLNTPLVAIRRTAAAAAVLGSIGVAGTAVLFAAVAHLAGLSWPAALLLGAIVSSTDAAAVFSVLRGSGVHLKRRVGGTLEVESGVNDPVAVILTMALTANLAAPGAMPWWEIPVDIVVQLTIGTAVGLGLGRLARLLLTRIQLPTGGLYPALTLAVALLTYGLATLLDGSGFLAVYLAGVVIGNGPLPLKSGLLRVHDALAWLGQIGMFLVLGLLAFPSRLGAVAPLGLALAVALAVVIRPAVVALCLLPFRYPLRETVYIGWVGLRGAVPIVLATYPVLSGAPGAEHIFDLVFFIVVTSAVIPGGTVAWLARRLGLERAGPPAPLAVLAIESRQPLQGELTSFYVTDAVAVAGVPLGDLPFPEGSAVALIVRGNTLVPPTPATMLERGDHAYVISRTEDLPLIQLMFGRPEAG